MTGKITIGPWDQVDHQAADQHGEDNPALNRAYQKAAIKDKEPTGCGCSMSIWVWVTIIALIVLFWGDPDLHDALIEYLTNNPERKTP